MKPAKEWNLVEIECNGPRLHLTINDQVLQDARLDEESTSSKSGKGPMAASGHIGLQCQTGHVEFRRIEIQVLD